MYIREAFDNIRKELGEVNFSETKLTDAHIKKALALVSKATGKPESALIDIVNKRIAEYQDLATKAPILYATIQKNIVEDTVFNMMDEHKVEVKGASKFKFSIFDDLIDWIKVEHDQFFPLRNFMDHKHLHEPKFVLTPDVDPKINARYKDIKTAAATAKGEFIFYKPFMQSLIDFANLKDIKPKGKKWKSNGGDIPDDYAYIEFLIIHEFMHYTYADFHYMKILKADPKIINWVGDFRTNYNLVKSGHHQLPMGLFNDNINLDRQHSYREMYDLVKAEFDKLPKEQQDKVKSALDKMADDHSQEGDDGDGDEDGDKKGGDGEEGDKKSDKEGEGDEKDGEGDKPGDKKGDKKGKGKGKGKGEPGEDEGDEDGDGDGEGGKKSDKKSDKKGKGTGDGDEPTEADVEEHNRKTHDKASQGPKEPDKAPSKEASQQKRNDDYKGKDNRTSATNNGDGVKIDWKKVKPTMNWQSLLRRMVQSASSDTEEVYTKPSPRSITTIDVARQIGAGAIKPGEVPREASMKICFVVDSSGSMGGVIHEVYSNIAQLLKRTSKDVDPIFWLIKFSDVHHKFLCNARTGVYSEVQDIGQKITKGQKGNLGELFEHHYGAGTSFNQSMVKDIDLLMKQQFNVCSFLDADILHGENWSDFISAYKKAPSLFFAVFNSQETFHAVAEKMGSVPKNFTYFSGDGSGSMGHNP